MGISTEHFAFQNIQYIFVESVQLSTSKVMKDVPQAGTQDKDLEAWIEQQVATYPKITTEELAKISGKTSKGN